MEIYFIRHGETAWNAQRRVQGRSNIPLNDYGIALAKKTREALQAEGIIFDACYSSPLDRAVQTAKILMEGTGIEPILDNRLVELDFGPYEGVSIPEVQTNPAYRTLFCCFHDPAHYIPEGTGEGYAAFVGRAGDFVKEILCPLEGKKERVLISCHGALIRAALCAIFSRPIETFWDSVQLNCAVNKIILADGAFSLAYEGKVFYEVEHPYVNPAGEKDEASRS